MLLSTLKCTGKPLQQRVLQPKKTAVPLVRYSDSGPAIHCHLTDIPSMITYIIKRLSWDLWQCRTAFLLPSHCAASDDRWPSRELRGKWALGSDREKVYRFGVHATHKTNFCWTWMKIIKRGLRGRWQKAREFSAWESLHGWARRHRAQSERVVKDTHRAWLIRVTRSSLYRQSVAGDTPPRAGSMFNLITVTVKASYKSLTGKNASITKSTSFLQGFLSHHYLRSIEYF